MQGLLILRVLLIGFIYAFLSVALYIIWRQFDRNTSNGEHNHEPAHVVVTDESGDSTEFQLRPVTAVGRSSDNHIVIDDPYTSTHHAIIVWRDRRWWVEDLESHNGTQLNDIMLQEPTMLTSGDVIRIGASELKFYAQKR